MRSISNLLVHGFQGSGSNMDDVFVLSRNGVGEFLVLGWSVKPSTAAFISNLSSLLFVRAVRERHESLTFLAFLFCAPYPTWVGFCLLTIECRFLSGKGHGKFMFPVPKNVKELRRRSHIGERRPSREGTPAGVRILP
jgi:hypothetical protein